MITTLDARRLPPPPPGGAVVSVGVFDGVHLGHKAILAANRERAGELGAVPTVVTFRRHPKRVLLGQEPRTLTSLEHRLELFRREGVEHTVVLTFDEALRDQPAEAFVQDTLVRGLGARAFVLGFDSKFGQGRRGTPALVREMGHDVRVVEAVRVGERAVSSTAIREAVELGDLEGAEAMLGRPVAVLGTVVRGDAIGRTLGFPTANLDLHHQLHPPPGVYAARARELARREPDGPGGDEAPVLDAVVNVGFRPTLDGEPPDRPRVEAHLLGFEGDLYGHTIELTFVRRLRPEQRFDGLEALKAQIARDVTAARQVLLEQPGR